MLHRQATLGDVHQVTNWIVANNVALAALVLAEEDEYKVAYNLDTGEILMLTDYATPTWVVMNSATPPTPNFAAFSAYRNAAMTPTASTPVKISLDQESFDVGGNFDLINGKFVAPYNGYYHFDGRMVMNATAILVVAYVYVNGASRLSGVQSGAATYSSIVSGLLYLSAGDEVELWCYTSSANSLQVGVPTYTYLHGYLVKDV